MKHILFHNNENLNFLRSSNKPFGFNSFRLKIKLATTLFVLFFMSSNLTQAASIIDTTMISASGEYQLLISLPDNYDSTESYAMVVALQPCNGTTTKSYLQALQPLSDSLQMIVVAPNLSKTGNWITDSNMDVITTSIDTVLAMFHVDPALVYLTGMSCNGEITLRQGLKKMYPFKGIFTWDPYLTSVNPKVMDLNSDMPVTIAVGTKDDYLAATLNLYDSLKVHGAKVNLVLVEGITHTFSFASFGNEMIHSMYYLLFPHSIAIDYSEGNLPNFEMTNTDPAKELTFTLTGETDHEYTVNALSSNSTLIANPSFNYSEADGKITLSFAPTAGKTGKAVIVLEVQQKNGTTYHQVTFTVKVTKPSTVSVADYESKLEIYPNPVNNHLFVKTDEEIIKVQIIDLTGKIILNTGCTNQSGIDVSTLHEGIYFLKASGKKQYKITEFLVK